MVKKSKSKKQVQKPVETTDSGNDSNTDKKSTDLDVEDSTKEGTAEQVPSASKDEGADAPPIVPDKKKKKGDKGGDDAKKEDKKNKKKDSDVTDDGEKSEKGPPEGGKKKKNKEKDDQAEGGEGVEVGGKKSKKKLDEKSKKGVSDKKSKKKLDADGETVSEKKSKKKLAEDGGKGKKKISAQKDPDQGKADEKADDKPPKTPRTPTNAKRGLGVDLEPLPSPVMEEPPDQFGPCQVDIQQARTAILLLQSPETIVVLEALNCLQTFCKKRDENKRLFIKMDGLVEAAKLIYNEDKVVQRLALKLIAITSSFHEAAIQLRDLEIAADLIKLASIDDQDPVVVEYTTFSLSSLAMLETGRSQIVQNAGVPVLINLLSHDDPDVQKNSAETVWRLLEDPVNVELITTKRSMEPVLKLVESEYPELQIVALSIMEKVSTRDPGVQVLESIESIHPLGEKLAISEFGDLHRSILRILSNMSINQSARHKIVPLVPSIARVLDTSPDSIAQVLALGLLGMLAIVPSVAKGLVDFGMCFRLEKILSTSDDLPMKEAAAFCVAQLSETDIRAKAEFIDVIGPLLKLAEVKDLSDPGFEYVMLALSTILEDGHKACPTFIAQNGLCVFRKLLEAPEGYPEKGLLSLLTCIGLIAAHWELRMYVVDAGILPAILIAMRTNKSIPFLTTAANSLCGILCNEMGRQQFLMEYDGYNTLVELISHEDYAVVLSSEPILQILATFPEVAKGLIERGIIQTIWERQNLISKTGPLRAAFERLISTHLPAKYAISGHIDPFDKLPDGFYDMGLLKSTDSFMTISQINWENKNPQRQILYLNWGSKIKDEAALKVNESLQNVQQSGQNLQSLEDAVTADLPIVKTEKDLVRLIARTVSDRLGGVLEKWRASALSEEQQVADLQVKHKSVVVPISMITTGAFRTRVLLFKYLCDVFGIPCSVERSEYKRMWNVVFLQPKPHTPPPPPPERPEPSQALMENQLQEELSELLPPVTEVERIIEPLPEMVPEVPTASVAEEPKKSLGIDTGTDTMRKFVVDLIFQPGALLPLYSYDADTYCYV